MSVQKTVSGVVRFLPQGTVLATIEAMGVPMQKFKPQFRRLLFIDREIKAGKYPNCASLAAEWEVSGKTIQRDLDYLVSYRGEWYLTSYCHSRQSIRTFGVSRITQAEVLDETFAMPAGMTADRMFGDHFGIFRRDTFQKVRIRFAPQAAPYIRERQWHPTQRITERRDGGLLLEFTTNHVPEVTRWLLSWGEDAIALSPASVVRDVARSLKRTAANYR